MLHLLGKGRPAPDLVEYIKGVSPGKLVHGTVFLQIVASFIYGIECDNFDGVKEGIMPRVQLVFNCRVNNLGNRC